MRFLLNRYVFIFQIIFASCVLSGCSPAGEDEPDYADEQWEEEELAEGDPYLQQHLDDGWRYGTLRVEFELHQRGEETIEQPAMRLRGPSTTSIKWQTHITATKEQPVLVLPDLNVTVPTDHADYKEAQFILESLPFYVSDSLEDGQLTSNIFHTLSWHHLEPESNQMIEGKRQVDEQGIISDLLVNRLNPSLYGPGWEAALDLATETHRISNFTGIPPDNAQPVTINEASDQSERYSFLLYPTPNTRGLNAYPYLDPEMPANFNEKITHGHLQTLAMLQQLHHAPALATMRAGVKSQATKDQLTLRYSYSGDKQIPYLAGEEGLTAKPDINTINIVITLTAD